MRKIAQDVTSFGKGVEKPDAASNRLLNKNLISYILKSYEIPEPTDKKLNIGIKSQGMYRKW